ncbi:hypothetical protein ACWGR4_13415 [Embleya sp. NPDC055664]
MVAVGERPKMRSVVLRFTDGSQIAGARIITESGLFWYIGPAEFRDVSSLDLRVYGQPILAYTPLGQRTEQLRVQLDEVTVNVTLLMVITAASPPEPVVVPKSPRRHIGSRARLLLGLALALVPAVVALVAAGQKSGPSNEQKRPAAAPASGTYCSVKQSEGVVSCFLAADQGRQGPVWSVMAPRENDPSQAWWTPAFPYWERATKQDLEAVDVLVRWEQPWAPLATAMNRHGFLDVAVEAAQRTAFISRWSHEPGSLRCA